MASLPTLSPQGEIVWQAILRRHSQLVSRYQEPRRPYRPPSQFTQPQYQDAIFSSQLQPTQNYTRTNDFDSGMRNHPANIEKQNQPVWQQTFKRQENHFDSQIDSVRSYGLHQGQGDDGQHHFPSSEIPPKYYGGRGDAKKPCLETEEIMDISDGNLGLEKIGKPSRITNNQFSLSQESYGSRTDMSVDGEQQSMTFNEHNQKPEVDLQTSTEIIGHSPPIELSGSSTESGGPFLWRMTDHTNEKSGPDRSVTSKQDNSAALLSVANAVTRVNSRHHQNHQQSPIDLFNDNIAPESRSNSSANKSHSHTSELTGGKNTTKSSNTKPQASKRMADVFKVPKKILEKKKRRQEPESPADRALNDLEELMDSNERKTKPKGRQFNIPLKEAKENALAQQTTELPRAGDLSEGERQHLQTELFGAPELGLTLTYSDGSSLLGPAPGQGKTKKSSIPRYVEGVVIAYPRTVGEGSELAFISFQLTQADVWTRKVLSDIMIGKGRKICYKADELIIALQKNAGISPGTDMLKWMVLDPGVAHWLLHSDHPAKSFEDMLSTLPDLSIKCPVVEAESVCGRLKVVGPAMAQLYTQLKKAQLWDLFLNLETPLTPILAAMHLRGIKVDTTELLRTANLLERKLEQLEEAAHMSAGRKFCLNSHAQLRQVLFEDLHLDKKLEHGSKIARTEVEGQKSTSQAVLLQLKDTHPLPAIVLEHRQLQKLKSTYVDGLLSCVETSGWIHTCWTQVSASTGRLAATQPNLQAVPKLPVDLTISHKAILGKAPEKVSIYARDPFHSQESYTLLAADFQQIEFRLLAHLSSDRELLSIFNENVDTDIFIQLTAQWLSKAPSEVTPADREQTKRVVYSVMYGAGKERLSEYLNIDAANAKDIIQSFLVAYPGVNTFTKLCISEAQKKGYQTTFFGRRRQLLHIRHPNFQVRAQAERQAVNFCVQGSAADLCKASMILVEKALAEKPHLDARLLLQIHDELLFEVKTDQLQEVAGLIKLTMEDRDALCGSNIKLKVPLAISLTHGQHWGHMESYLDLPLKEVQDQKL